MRKQDVVASVLFSALAAFVLSTLPLYSQIQVGAGGGGGGGGTPGGANTNVQFNNSSAFGGDAGFTYAGTGQVTITNSTVNTTPLTSTGYSLTGSGATSLMSLTGTINTTGVTDIFAMHITDTARGAGSTLMNLYGGASGTTSEFKVSNTGAVTAAQGFTTVGGNITLNGGSLINTNNWSLSASGDGQFQFDEWNNSFNDFLTVTGNATWQFGRSDAAAPAAQTLTFQSVVAGTSNTTGANATINGSRGTGTGAGGDIIFQAARAGTTGTSQNALQTVFTVKNTGVIQDNVVFSAAGTPLPTCNAGAEGSRGAVSDALTPTFLTAYVSGGAVHASVYCDGTSWKTD
jgi:hypothetical protein